MFMLKQVSMVTHISNIEVLEHCVDSLYSLTPMADPIIVSLVHGYRAPPSPVPRCCLQSPTVFCHLHLSP